jgi:hypothetical protein
VKKCTKSCQILRKKFPKSPQLHNMHSFSHAQIFRCTTTKRPSQFTGTGAAHRQFAVQNLSKTFNISRNIYTHNIPSLKFLSKYNSCQSQSPEHSTTFVSKANTSLV